MVGNLTICHGSKVNNKLISQKTYRALILSQTKNILEPQVKFERLHQAVLITYRQRKQKLLIPKKFQILQKPPQPSQFDCLVVLVNVGLRRRLSTDFSFSLSQNFDLNDSEDFSDEEPLTEEEIAIKVRHKTQRH